MITAEIGVSLIPALDTYKRQIGENNLWSGKTMFFMIPSRLSFNNWCFLRIFSLGPPRMFFFSFYLHVVQLHHVQTMQKLRVVFIIFVQRFCHSKNAKSRPGGVQKRAVKQEKSPCYNWFFSWFGFLCFSINRGVSWHAVAMLILQIFPSLSGDSNL